MRIAILLVLSAALAVSGCGQKGPLYLSEKPPPGVKPKKPEPYQSVPYPEHRASESAASEQR